jgi:prepilin-type N-terminal cleavage/methylation domain-containing protein
MNSVKSHQRGFSVVEIIIVVVVLGLIGFIGWRLYDSTKNKSTDMTQTDETSLRAPEVKNNEDLQKAEDFVNNIDLDTTLNTSEIDSSLSQ